MGSRVEWIGLMCSTGFGLQPQAIEKLLALIPAGVAKVDPIAAYDG